MKLINRQYMKNNTIAHPYDSNPGYVAKINTFYFSRDKKAIVGYWEAPAGWFEAQIEEWDEINYVIEGEIEISIKGQAITAKSGDCFLLESGEYARWIVKKPIKTIYFIYPANKGLVDFFMDLIESKQSENL